MKKLSQLKILVTESFLLEKLRASAFWPFLRVLFFSLLFLLSFSIPLYIALNYLGITGSYSYKDAVTKEKFDEFTKPVRINAQGSFLRIPDSDQLVPREGKDFAVLIWFNLKRLPSAGEKLILLSKYLGGDGAKLGYAIAVRREDGAYFPTIFWGDSKSSGRWYEFPEVKLLAKSWVALVLTLHDHRYLGLHMLQEPSSGLASFSLLGGYDLGPGAGEQMGKADIIVGAAQDRLFRGSIGPIAVFSKKNLDNDLKGILKASAREPAAIVEQLEEKELRLWISGEIADKSIYKNKIEWVKP